jgi:glucan biosynthesis protein C
MKTKMTESTDQRPTLSQATEASRLPFFDTVRNLAMMAVVLHHAVAAYSGSAVYWAAHDTTSVMIDGVRQILDMFMMPIFFFIAGYFALLSIRRKGSGRFLQDRLKRLGIPWLLAIFVFIPLSWYGVRATIQDNVPDGGFLNYWLAYVGNFGALQVGPLSSLQTNQVQFWFLSLLILIMVVFAFLYTVHRRWKKKDAQATKSLPVLEALLLFGLLTVMAYFVATLFIPDELWVMVNLLVQFQPTRMILYVAYFGLGVYAASQKWFADGQPPGRLGIWLPVSVLLSIAFLIVGQAVFANPDTSHHLPAGLLLAFALIRSFLCLSVLIVFMSYAIKYWNRPSPFNQRLAASSYIIYLTHITFIVPLQRALMMWSGGPALIKAGIIFFLGLAISYGASLLIRRFSRVTALALVGLALLVAAVTL